MGEHFNGQNAGTSITVMNFANGHRAGGGYLGGARAQEEALCRQFPLYHPSMVQKQSTLYPFGAAVSGPPREKIKDVQARKEYSAVLFTPPTQMLRDHVERHLRPLQEERKFNVSFVAAVAPRLAKDLLDDDLLCEAIENCILGSAMHQRLHEPERRGQPRILILGAWGCGAFGNDPFAMAKRFTRVLADRRAVINQLWSG